MSGSPRLPRAERRRQLGEAARAEFVERGFARASMDGIAERAGVSKPVLYQHFPGKQELFLELLDREIASLTSRLADALESAADDRARVTATVAVVFDHLGSPGSAHRLIFDSGADLDPEVRRRVEAVQTTVADDVARVLRQRTGLEGAEAQTVARGVVAFVFGAARHWADRLDPVDRPDAARAAAVVEEVLWSGLDALPD